MEYSDETRRYSARISRVGIIAAILYALLYGALHFFPIYGFEFRLYLLTAGMYNVIPELAVIAVGLIALLLGGILSLTLREKPAVAQAGWRLGRIAVLLAAPVGFIRSQLLLSWTSLVSSPQMDFLVSFATLAAVFAGYARSRMPRGGLTEPAQGVHSRRMGRNTAIVGGIMLVSVLWLLWLTWKSNRSLSEYWSPDEKLERLLWSPLKVSVPVALTVTLGYLLPTLASRLDEAPRKGRFGKGTLLLGWVTLGISALSGAAAVLVQYRLLSYTANSLMGGLQGLQELQALQMTFSVAGSLLSILTLCRILPCVQESKTVLWGARGVLGVISLRCLSLWMVETVATVIEMKKQGASDMGIIGGADVSVTLLAARVNSWLGMIFTLLSVAFLCILSVGLTRRHRVSKAFWTVPILTAASTVLPLLLQILWELFLRNTAVNTGATLWFSLVSVTVVPTVMTLTRSLVGILTLTRAPADEVPPPPASEEGAEAPRSRVEDYLYQL